MKITWFASGIATAAAGGLESARASTRFRCLIPAAEFTALGHDVNIIQSDKIANPADLRDDEFGDVVIFIKSFVQIDEIFAARARQLGRLVLYDFCDFDFLKPDLMGHRSKMTALADRCVAVSEALATAVAETLEVAPPVVISDPYEGPEGAPKFAPQDDLLRLVWFGHAANTQELFDQLQSLAAFGEDTPLLLDVVVPAVDGIAEAFSQANKKFAGCLELKFTSWSLENTWQSLAQGDLVIIPSIDNQKKKAKSPNRVVESLRNGRFVIANPVSAYLAYGDFIKIDTDIVAGLRWTMENAGEIAARIRQGQKFIDRHNAPAAVAEAWLKLLKSL